MKKGFIIAIDGPVASGKGTLVLMLAEKLNAFYMNTGAMYRGVALRCIEDKIDINNENALEEVLKSLEFSFKENKVFLNKEDITEKIKTPDIANKSSAVASKHIVRKHLVDIQKRVGFGKVQKGKIVVAEGRDIGTKVFPEAEIKIFLVANSEIRAKRRLEQYKEKGLLKSFEEVLTEINKRDEADKNRSISPLVQANDAIEVDTTNDEINDTFNKVIMILREKRLYD